MRVLMVDDNLLFSMMLTEFLKGEDYEVINVGSARLAREQVASDGDFGAVICDARLPDGDGVELAVGLAQRMPGARMILISGYSIGPLPGGWRFLQKPFRPAELLTALTD